MELTTIGIDLAKSVFAVSGADRRGKVVMRRQLRRAQVLEFMGKLGPCVVGMEAGGGAHHWARAIGKLGHEVRLLSAALVGPYRSGPNKHHRNDADAICEAVRRPQMRYVAVKSVAQQDQLALHRVRAQLLKQRIAQSNLIRALLHERGVGGTAGRQARSQRGRGRARQPQCAGAVGLAQPRRWLSPPDEQCSLAALRWRGNQAGARGKTAFGHQTRVTARTRNAHRCLRRVNTI